MKKPKKIRALKRQNRKLKRELHVAECGLLYLTDLGWRWKRASK